MSFPSPTWRGENVSSTSVPTSKSTATPRPSRPSIDTSTSHSDRVSPTGLGLILVEDTSERTSVLLGADTPVKMGAAPLKDSPASQMGLVPEEEHQAVDEILHARPVTTYDGLCLVLDLQHALSSDEALTFAPNRRAAELSSVTALQSSTIPDWPHAHPAISTECDDHAALVSSVVRPMSPKRTNIAVVHRKDTTRPGGLPSQQS